MKRYEIVIKVSSVQVSYTIAARNEQSARNKALKRARASFKDKTLDDSIIESAEYKGFYLGGQFIPVN